MTQQMKLHPQPFALIAQGLKTIELRLNDEKRQQLRVGDVIEFSLYTDPSKTLSAQVVALHHFDSFEQLYRGLPLERCGYLPHEISSANPQDMEQYYSRSQQEKYGVLGIEIILER